MAAMKDGILSGLSVLRLGYVCKRSVERLEGSFDHRESVLETPVLDLHMTFNCCIPYVYEYVIIEVTSSFHC